MAYTTIDNPELYFQNKAYTGDGSSNQAITFDGSENMKPDWVWIKNRSNAHQHTLIDSVRGVNKALLSNSTAIEDTDDQYGWLSSFNTNGFTTQNGSAASHVGPWNVNKSGHTYISWNWKAGTSVSGSTGGSGTSKSYSGSVNTTSGFSIITYVGNGTAGHTIPHHLGAVPQVLIVKGRDQVENWTVYHEGLTSNNYALRLNDSAAEFSQTLSWNDTTPTSSVFTLGGGAGTSDYTNRDGINMIAYVFSEKKGYSSFGSYTGNGNADGPFVYTGFRPAWILYKNTARSISWLIHDNKRLGYNPDNDEQHPDTSDADGTDDRADILSNGFKIRESSNLMNVSGEKVIYLAFAESPFVNSSGVPNNAR